ncbi:hypothetical protein [Pseudomonas sp. Marseille-QA0892]
MIDLPSTTDETVAMGWPWHGRIVTRPREEAIVELPNGKTVPVGFDASRNTYLFDIGYPDIPSETIEAAGGKWWGRAILRGGPLNLNYAEHVSYYGSGVKLANSTNDWLPGVPLVFDPVIEGGRRRIVFVSAAFIGQSELELTLNYQGAVDRKVRIPITLDQLGNGAGQPECVTRQQSAGRYESYGQVNDQFLPNPDLEIADFRANKLLVVIAATAHVRAPNVPYPMAYESRSPKPATVIGLLEIVLQPAVLDSTVDPRPHVQLRLIEDRASALGNPVYETHDETGPQFRDYLAKWTQQLGLLNAWYAPDGTVRTARFDRIQSSVQERWPASSEGPAGQRDIIETTMRIRTDSGTVIDEMVMRDTRERFDHGANTIQLIRTVEVTGEDPDIADSGRVTATFEYFDPAPIFQPGFHADSIVAYISRVSGRNIIREQDIRMLWLLRCSNTLSCLGYTREPFAYADGQDTMPVKVRRGPLISPKGSVMEVDTRTLLHSRSASPDYEYSRSFWWFNGLRYASYNPVTGEIARNDETASYSWV